MSQDACEGCPSYYDYDVNENDIEDYFEYAQHLLQVHEMNLYGAGIVPQKEDKIFLWIVRREVSRIEHEVQEKRQRMKRKEK